MCKVNKKWEMFQNCSDSQWVLETRVTVTKPYDSGHLEKQVFVQ